MLPQLDDEVLLLIVFNVKLTIFSSQVKAEGMQYWASAFIALRQRINKAMAGKYSFFIGKRLK